MVVIPIFHHYGGRETEEERLVRIAKERLREEEKQERIERSIARDLVRANEKYGTVEKIKLRVPVYIISEPVSIEIECNIRDVIESHHKSYRPIFDVRLIIEGEPIETWIASQVETDTKIRNFIIEIFNEKLLGLEYSKCIYQSIVESDFYNEYFKSIHHCNEPFYQHVRRRKIIEFREASRKTHFVSSFKNNVFWGKSGLSRKQIKELYRLVKKWYFELQLEEVAYSSIVF